MCPDLEKVAIWVSHPSVWVYGLFMVGFFCPYAGFLCFLKMLSTLPCVHHTTHSKAWVSVRTNLLIGTPWLNGGSLPWEPNCGKHLQAFQLYIICINLEV